VVDCGGNVVRKRAFAGSENFPFFENLFCLGFHLACCLSLFLAMKVHFGG
jgi:hypothetical protein